MKFCHIFTLMVDIKNPFRESEDIHKNVSQILATIISSRGEIARKTFSVRDGPLFFSGGGGEVL